MPQRKKTFIGVLVVVAVIIVIVVAQRTGGLGGFFTSGGGGTPSGYQAVFLTNNQVYFGRLSGLQ